MDIRPFQEADRGAVIALWQACGLTRPWNDPSADIDRKLAVQRELFLVGSIENAVVATVMAGYEGHRGWLNYLAVAPAWQRHGFGRRLIATVEQALLERGCPKVNLQVRTGNAAVIDFYEAIGYSVDPTTSLGKRLIPDN